jgi:branched-chain amino acid transport system substrate-binding protein
MKRRLWLRHLAAVTALAMVVAACGTDDPDDDDVAAPVDDEAVDDEEEPEPEPVDFEPIPMNIGTLLPQTGALAPIIDALEEPIRMGAEEINELFPDLVTLEHSDSGTDPSVATENVDAFLTGAHHAIIGAAASGVSTAIVDKVQDAQVVMCSGSNTAAERGVYDAV